MKLRLPHLARYLRKSSFREVLTKISLLVDFIYICIRTQNPKFEIDQESIHLCNVSFYAGGRNCKITEFEFEVVVYSKLHQSHQHNGKLIEILLWKNKCEFTCCMYK